MSDLATEYDSTIKLIIGEYRRLKKLDPSHKLLKYICNVNDDGFDYSSDKKVTDEFLDRFAPEEDCKEIVSLIHYFIAMERAANEIEGKHSDLEKEVN